MAAVDEKYFALIKHHLTELHTAVADLAGGPIAGWSYDLGGGRALHWVSAGLGLLASVVLLRLPPAEVEAVVPGDPRASHTLPEPLTTDAWH